MKEKNQNVFCGNNIDLLKQYPDNYFDSIVTDPPYGLGKEPNAEEMLKAWLETGFLEVKGSGFMGKEWDSFVPQPIFWKEIYRVLKHGGHVVSFFGTRTYDWGCMAMRLAGFEIRDCIQWIYGSGFPKSHNIGKAIDKIQGNEREVIGVSDNTRDRNNHDYNSVGNFGSNEIIETRGQSEWEGWGSALKPANEPIVLARKPLEKGLSIAENVLKWGTGAINIDASRIESDKNLGGNNPSRTFGTSYVVQKEDSYIDNSNGLGRFPSNVILTHHPDCECLGYKKVGSGKVGGYNYKGNNYDVEGFVPNNSPEANSNYGEEIVENWNCHDDCPIKILDEQSGILKSGYVASHHKINDSSWFGASGKYCVNSSQKKDLVGGASRFFYVAKSSQWERNFGLDEFEDKRFSAYGYDVGLGEKAEGMFKDRNPIKKNNHPTIKPIKLMQYLVRMITPPNGIVLDPFCGSGTTGIACKIDDFDFVGLEQDNDYVEIAKARISAFNVEKHLIDETKIYQNRSVNDEKNDGYIQLSLFD